MKVLKIDDDDLTQACKKLREANTKLAEGKKSADDAKKVIDQKLLELRQVNIRTLPVGELVSIDKVIFIEIGKQTRFDEAKFSLDQPGVYADYKKDVPIVKYKPLV